MTQLSRRTFLKSLVAGAVVVGFDRATSSWVTSAHAAEQLAPNFPTFDGVLYTDTATRAEAAEDYGHIIHRTPNAVLKPGSTNDIVKLVRFAKNNNIKISGRGQGHSTYGQPQIQGGVVIDMSTLATVHEIGRDYVIADAGLKWHQLLDATLAQGLTPPVMTDYIELSIGGTLSVGGIGGASHQHGVQIDNVLELTVVTGEGNLETCSKNRNKDLFESVLGGLGQFAIIVRAKLKLVRAETSARVFNLFYDDIETFTDDQIRLIRDGRFEYVEGQVVAKAGGGWNFMLEAVSFYSANKQPNNNRLLRNLRYTQGTEVISDTSYFDFLNRLAPTEAFLRSIGVWFLPHPWLDLFIKSRHVNNFVGNILETLTLEDTGQGPILLYPVKTNKFTKPFFRVPDGEIVFLFDILRTAPNIPEVINAMLADNREMFETNRDLGGNRYAIGAIEFSQNDWKQHFGEVWNDFRRAKNRYDPCNILGGGQGIF
ncbi:FAD-binding protein [Herpetosiphon geysericola]|uniref:Oxidoreductase n=1 Tax=Herpetosiphon geysericola TaxID=70996 RepID=A0A0P6YGC8_9CHLR|nr:FAD-binding protein [Herpetosiphon geysericola]KPL81301.1 oxidoreductase [Herpetosiphon geysericola]